MTMDSFIAYISPNTLTVASDAFSTMKLLSDLGTTGLERRFRRFEDSKGPKCRLPWQSKPISQSPFRGFGRLYVNILLCPASRQRRQRRYIPPPSPVILYKTFCHSTTIHCNYLFPTHLEHFNTKVFYFSVLWQNASWHWHFIRGPYPSSWHHDNFHSYLLSQKKKKIVQIMLQKIGWYDVNATRT